MNIPIIKSNQSFEMTKEEFYRAKNARQIDGKPHLRQIDLVNVRFIDRPVKFIKKSK